MRIHILLSVLFCVVADELICSVTPTNNETVSMRICYNSTSGETITDFIAAEEVTDELAALSTDLDVTWTLICGFLVFFMQSGFSLLEAGCVSAKNVQNILYKNIMDAVIGALAFWLLGYGFAYGGPEDNGFIGITNFGLANENLATATYHSWFFQWAFAATAATIVSGAVAERTKITAYFIYTIYLSCFVYPVVVHWVWDNEGWLSAFNAKPFTLGNSPNGMLDFAGSGVVHMVGGWAGFCGAAVVGPRTGRFDGTVTHVAHNKLLACLGCLILWFGWYGFNAGSTLGVSGGVSALASKVTVTTTIAAASASLVCTLYGRIVHKQYDLLLTLNGILAGLVSITASCAIVDPWHSFLIGIIGAFIYIGSSKLLVKIRIDDPLDACPIHGCCGFFGVLACGIFATDDNVFAAYGKRSTGVASGEQFGVQLIGGLCIFAWTICTCLPLFLGIKYTIGIRVQERHEAVGLDASEHGGAAYTDKNESASAASSKPARVVLLPQGPFGESLRTTNLAQGASVAAATEEAEATDGNDEKEQLVVEMTSAAE